MSARDARRRVLLVYSRVGGGHLSAAHALAGELGATGRARTRLVDVYVECGRFPVTLFPQLYALIARKYPKLWSLIFQGSNVRISPDLFVRGFLRTGIERLLADEQPDLVVSVLPVVNGLLARAAHRHGARMEVVLTDWASVHRSWVARGVDHYTTPTRAAREDCVRYGAPVSVVDVVGIPVRRAFADVGSTVRGDVRHLAELGLEPDRFTILMMVGAEGSPRALESVRALAALNLDVQLVVVCGRDEHLQQQVAALPTRITMRALGFVDQISTLMTSADLLVTKAGGLTLSEAFCCGVPVVVYDVLAGQEEGNLRFALGEHAVAYADTAARLPGLVAELFDNPAQRAALAQHGRRLARPDAAARIAARLLGRLDAARA